MYSLDLKQEDPLGVPTTDKIFALLRDFLQPDSTLTLEFTATSIEDLLPAKAPLSEEIADFGDSCIEVAEQIPYLHTSQLKLAGLLEYLSNSLKLGRQYDSKHIPYQYVRYQRLGESLRETLNGPDKETPRSYVNFHAFIANLDDRRVFSTDPTWAIWAQRDAHEGRDVSTNEERVPNEIYVLAGAQWIFWYGQTFFKQVLFPGDVSDKDLGMWAPGPLYGGKAHLTLNRWHFWRDGYRAVASCGKEKEKGYSQECKSVAAKAAALMDALEENMTF